jgi:hypothetical protein
MIHLRPRNVSPCRSLIDPSKLTRPPSWTVVFRDAPCFIPFFTDIIIHPATSGIGSSVWSFSPGAVYVRRIVFRSLLWSASLGLSSGHGHSHRTLAFSPTSELCIRFPSGVDIHTSLAGGLYVPASHLFQFFHQFPQLNVSVSPAHFRIACFRHIAPRFLFWLPKDRVCIKGVDEASYIKNKSSTQASAQPCVYDDLTRHSGCAPQSTYQYDYPPSPAYLCAALRHTCKASIFRPFCVLGSWDCRDISFITPSHMLRRLPICLSFLGSRSPNFLSPCVFLVIHVVVGLFIPFVADLPSFFSLYLFHFSACINIDSAHRSDYRIASYPSLLCYSQSSPLSPF